MLKTLVIGFLIFGNIVLAQDVDTRPAFDLPGFADKTTVGQVTDDLAKGNSVQIPGIIFNFLPSTKPYVLFRNSFAVGQNVGTGYRVTPGIGAHKIHRRTLPWNRARRICTDEGAHLAVIRSESEADMLYQMMQNESIEDAWLGLHDKFEEGDWVSVNDEPIASTNWGVWAKDFPNNPDNWQKNQHCARLVKKSKGMDDDNCELAKPFICKFNI